MSPEPTDYKLSPSQALQRLLDNGVEVTLRTVQIWCKKKLIKAKKIGGRWYISAKAVERFSSWG